MASKPKKTPAASAPSAALTADAPLDPPARYAGVDTPRAVRDFRRAAAAVLALSLGLVAYGAATEGQAPFEVGLGLGLISGLVLLSTYVEAAHARLAFLHPANFFLVTWAELDEEARLEREAKGGAYDYRPLVALSVGAVCLAVMEYFGHTVHFAEFADEYDPTLRASPFFELMGYSWWSAFRVGGYFVVPALVAVFAFKERLRDQGLETRGFFEHAWIYAVSYVVVLVCVILVARNDAHFQTYYPFYRRATRSWLDFWSWELLYAAQFFSLEFFFRGFWLQSMKRTMGSYAIMAMVVPYCMIHFGKPFLETIAAILAGVVLGTLSMKTRSIWSGFLIHVSVALSMDMAALMMTVGLPETWTP